MKRPIRMRHSNFAQFALRHEIKIGFHRQLVVSHPIKERPEP